MLTASQIAELKTLMAQATTGLWYAGEAPVRSDKAGIPEHECLGIYSQPYSGNPIASISPIVAKTEQDEINATLICSAVNALPELIAAAEREQKLREALEGIAELDYSRAATNGCAHSAVMTAKAALEAK